VGEYRGRSRDCTTGALVDEEEFLLHADGETWFNHPGEALPPCA
jgi:hypothetical protein